MALPRAELFGLAAALSGALLVPGAALAQAPQRLIYCCDVGGQPVCGDILPAACYGRAYREISPSGLVRRVVPAPLTEEEITQRDALERQRRADEAARLKQQRLDEALLETYRSLQHLDERRERELGAIDRVIHILRERETELVTRQHALVEEVARAEQGKVPPVLQDNIRSLDGEIVAQRSVIEAKLRERSALLDRFEEDRRRYIELTAPGSDRR